VNKFNKIKTKETHSKVFTYTRTYSKKLSYAKATRQSQNDLIFINFQKRFLTKIFKKKFIKDNEKNLIESSKNNQKEKNIIKKKIYQKNLSKNK